MMKFRESWTQLNDLTIGSAAYWDIAIQNRSFWLDMAPIIAQYTSGNVLDIGAGRLAWRETLLSKAAQYVSADMSKEHPDLDVIADLTKRLPWNDESFSTVFCCSVLEHLLDFDAALSEMRRVLKRGGRLILSVPFLYYRHGDPHDYFRFTTFALDHLASKHQFKICHLVSSGGIAEIGLNPLSILVNIIWFQIKLRILITPTTRLATQLTRWLDRRLDPRRRYATNNIVVLEKMT